MPHSTAVCEDMERHFLGCGVPVAEPRIIVLSADAPCYETCSDSLDARFCAWGLLKANFAARQRSELR